MGALALLGLVRSVRARAGVMTRAMLFPVLKLKQVSRGFGPLPGHGFHTGVDLTAPYGAPVRAAAAGTVVYAGSYFGYGNMIDLQHADGLVTRYAHLSAFSPSVRVGSEVRGGSMLGAVGTSGHAHGPHLHFEVRVAGQAVDPKPYIGIDGVAAGTRAEQIAERLADPREGAAMIAPLDDSHP